MVQNVPRIDRLASTLAKLVQMNCMAGSDPSRPLARPKQKDESCELPPVAQHVMSPSLSFACASLCRTLQILDNIVVAFSFFERVGENYV